MTPALPPHPQRCQTCKNIECWYYDSEEQAQDIWDFTFDYGCASHTTTQSEREQMLDILDDFIDGNKIIVHDEENEESDYMNLTGEIRAKIAELRSQSPSEAH